MEREGVALKSKIPYASSVVVIKKKNWQLSDLRGLCNEHLMFCWLRTRMNRAWFIWTISLFLEKILNNTWNNNLQFWNCSKKLISVYNQKNVFFGYSQVEYLRLIVSATEVATDPRKVEAMKQFPCPSNLTMTKSFLGLNGYYRRLIKDYSKIAGPLYRLAKKCAFHLDKGLWTSFWEAQGVNDLGADYDNVWSHRGNPIACRCFW